MVAFRVPFLVSLKFLQTCLPPLARLKTLLGLSKGPGFGDGDEVSVGSGVEGVISSRVIGVIIGVRRVFLVLIILWGSSLSRGVIIII